MKNGKTGDVSRHISRLCVKARPPKKVLCTPRGNILRVCADHGHRTEKRSDKLCPHPTVVEEFFRRGAVASRELKRKSTQTTST